MISALASKFSTSSVPEVSIASRPQTPEQWKRALQGVKLLYVQRQYKQCATRSDEILKIAREPVHPAYKTYLYFYSAISYEVLGRTAHNYSGTKIPLLHSALDCFITCNAVLPATISVPEDPVDETSPALACLEDSILSTQSYDSVGTLVSSITSIIDKSIDCPEDDPFISDNEHGHDIALDAGLDPDLEFDLDAALSFKLAQDEDHDDGDMRKGRLFPSPLRIRKSVGDFDSILQNMVEPDHAAVTMQKPVNRLIQLEEYRCPPPLPLKIMPATDVATTREPTKRDSPVEKHTISRTPAKVAAIARYNNTIQFLRSQISSSVSDIHSLMDEVILLQRARQSSHLSRAASFWSFSPVKDESNNKHDIATGSGRQLVKETMEERIVRLRCEGWATVGLKNKSRGWKGKEYYKEYCSSVLDELYLGND